jgi:hypothetical protein
VEKRMNSASEAIHPFSNPSPKWTGRSKKSRDFQSLASEEKRNSAVKKQRFFRSHSFYGSFFQNFRVRAKYF